MALVFRAFLLALACCAFLVPAQAQAHARWLKAETTRFIVYGDGSERDLRDYAVKLENFDALLRFYHGMDDAEAPPRKLEIYLLEDRDDIRRLAPQLSDNAAGFYSAGLGDVYGAAVRSLDMGRENDDIIFHEYVHHFMLQHFPSTYPAWLVEGYAEYLMTAEVSAGRFEVGRFNSMRVAALRSGPRLAARDLLTLRNTDLPAGRQRGAYYARVWLLTHYMLSDPARKTRLMAYVRALHAGQDSAAAWTQAGGEDFETLERALDTYMRQPYRSMVYERPAPAAVAVSVSPMPASADDLILLGQRARAGGIAPEDRPALVEDIRRAAARHPGDRFARLTLARAEVLYGDRAAGEAILQDLLAADPADLDALRLMGRAKLRARALAEARGYFATAYKIEPNHYQTLYGYAQARSADPDYPTDNTLNVLRLAVQLAPQVGALRLNAGRAMARRRHDEEALNLLRPVANNPHGGGNAERARRLMDRIEAGEAPAADEEDKGGEGDKGDGGG